MSYFSKSIDFISLKIVSLRLVSKDFPEGVALVPGCLAACPALPGKALLAFLSPNLILGSNFLNKFPNVDGFLVENLTQSKALIVF